MKFLIVLTSIEMGGVDGTGIAAAAGVPGAAGIVDDVGALWFLAVELVDLTESPGCCRQPVSVCFRQVVALE